ncbi:MAG: cation transporter [Gammaproteobacteria bacterium]|nr:cation transporter [Gammaproteobacteria bacterium]
MTETRSAASNSRSRLSFALLLTATYMVAEIIGGLLTGSLALLADAAHMGTDVGGLALALFAIWLAGKPANPSKTYGYYRAEILAALMNGMMLFGVAFYILYEAYQRFNAPVEVNGLPMLVVASVGLAVNLTGLFLLKAGAAESLNVKGAYLEVVSDMLSSLGVMVAAGLIWLTGWKWVDPAFSMLIGVFILPRTWSLIREAVDILMQSMPRHLNSEDIEQAIREQEDVQSVHDLHVWTITSGKIALSGHIQIVPTGDSDRVISGVNRLLNNRFGIAHATLQVEKEIDSERCATPKH